ncbi:MAG: carboxypeptidase-like regulatory domain-containing protein [Aureliella sp.]
MNTKIASLVATGLCLFLFVGCGPPETYSCSGTVTHDGEPVPYLEIVFEPENPDATRPPRAMANENGEFEMKWGRKKGVPPGNYNIHILDPAEADGGDTSKQAPDPEKYKYVVDRYSPLKSDLKYVSDANRSGYELKLDTKEYTGPDVKQEKMQNTTDVE